jgi:hypothetical protein
MRAVEYRGEGIASDGDAVAATTTMAFGDAER